MSGFCVQFTKTSLQNSSVLRTMFKPFFEGRMSVIISLKTVEPKKTPFFTIFHCFQPSNKWNMILSV